MPPKKQEQSQLAQYKPCFILPIFTSGHKSESANALVRPVNIKKNIDNAKIIQILKDKGLEPFIVNGQINQKGRLFVCDNLKTVCDQFIVSLNKPVDPKKDVKKDTKKQGKKQQPVVVENVIPPIQINQQKTCNDFFVFNSIPTNVQELQKILQKDLRIDIVVVIKQKIKPGSRKPNYDLLDNNRTMQDIQKNLRETHIDTNFLSKSQNKEHIDYQSNANQMVEMIKQHRAKSKVESQYKNLIILQIPYLNDLSNPQNNQVNFIKDFFQQACKCTKQLQQYNIWKTSRKLKSMIEPIKEVVKKQVQVQQKPDKNKKGGKSAQPVFQTIEQTIYRRYQDQPGNAKSDLKQYKKIKKIKAQNKKIQSTLNHKDNESMYRDLLNNMLDCFSDSKSSQMPAAQRNYKQQVQKISTQIKRTNQTRPIHKISNQTIINKLRNINYSKNLSMQNHLHFQFPKIQCLFTFMELLQKYTKNIGKCNKEELHAEYIINKLQNMVRSQSPKMIWDFHNRKFVQKFSREQLLSIINQQLLNDPQFFTGALEAEGIRLLVSSRTNPPGRVLYHNTIIDEKVLPNFQIWKQNFLGSQQRLNKQQFYDYLFEDAGNLSIKTKNMMPTDNSVIRDSMYTIGSKHFNILKLSKGNTRFGITKNKLPNGENTYVYWHDIQSKFRFRVLKTKLHIFGDIHQQGSKQPNQQKKTDKIQNIQKVYTTLGVFLESKDKYTVKMDPNPIIYWQNPRQQKIRKINGLGQITSYHVDGSIHIYKPNGDTSIYRNGRWKRIINDEQLMNGNQVRKLQVNTLNEGQNLIKIRQDQTIIITDIEQTFKKIIFVDGTQIYQNFNPNKQNSILKQRIRQIKNPNQGPFIRIYIPRDYNLNVVGYGSAFAYLGFKNLLERSYDGYLFQFIDFDISSHYYIERYDKNGKIFTQEVRLITHRDGSMIKINCRAGTIVYVSPSPYQLLTQQILHQRWLQTFTTPIHHGQGVFDIDLNTGHIQNKDSQTNKFIAKVDQRSDSHIAVSFITQEQEDSGAFPNGFHIKHQNYFLPHPTNYIPPRIFTINQDGTGTQYLQQSQIGNMKAFTITTQYEGSKKILQYTRETRPNTNYMNITFSKPVNTQIFGLPDMLKTPKTRQSLIPPYFYDVECRVIQQINWKSDYHNVISLQNQLKQEMNQKKSMRQSRKPGDSGKSTKLQNRYE